MKSVYPLKKIKSGGDDEFIFRFSEVKAEYFNKFSFDNRPLFLKIFDHLQ